MQIGTRQCPFRQRPQMLPVLQQRENLGLTVEQFHCARLFFHACDGFFDALALERINNFENLTRSLRIIDQDLHGSPCFDRANTVSRYKGGYICHRASLAYQNTRQSCLKNYAIK